MRDHTICHIMEAWVKGMGNFFDGDRWWEVAKGFDLGGHRHRNWQSTRLKICSMLTVKIKTRMLWGMDDSGNHKSFVSDVHNAFDYFGFLPGIDLWQK